MELQDLAAPFPRMGSQSRDCALLWRACWNGWVSIYLFLFLFPLYIFFHLSFFVSYISLCLPALLQSAVMLRAFSPLVGFFYNSLCILPTRPVQTHLSTTPPPVSLHSFLLSPFHPASIFPHPLSPPPVHFDGFEWNLSGSLQFVPPPDSLFGSLSLPLFGCVTPPPTLPPSLSQSLQAPLYILFEFRQTKDIWVSFLAQAKNGEDVDVCVKGLLFRYLCQSFW